MKKTILLSIIALSLAGFGCKKKNTEAEKDERVPPDLAFKSGAAYVSGDITTTKQDTVVIGVITTKTEDELTSFNASVSYDGSSNTTTFFNHTLSSGEVDSYSTDINYCTRNQTGREDLSFSIVDRDGNITKKIITITVQ